MLTNNRKSVTYLGDHFMHVQAIMWTFFLYVKYKIHNTFIYILKTCFCSVNTILIYIGTIPHKTDLYSIVALKALY